MKRLPDSIKNKLQPNTRAVYWGRRVGFENVPEAGAIAKKFYFGLFIGYHMSHMLEIERPSYWVGVFLAILWVCHKEIVGIIEWWHEIYVVVQDDANNSGRVYRFWGWLKKRSMNEAITPSSPLMIEERLIWYDVWAKLTGEKMVRLRLWSQNSPNVFLDARRVHPDFGAKISEVRGKVYSPGGGVGETPFRAVYDIEFARSVGNIDDDLARATTTHLVKKQVYGGS